MGLAVDSVGQQHPGDEQAERDRDSQHWLSFSFSSTWHVYEAFSSLVRLILSISGPSLSHSLFPLCVLLLTYASRYHYLSVNKGEEQRGGDLISLTGLFSKASN